MLDLPNVTLLTGRKVIRLETDASGATVTEVVCETEQGEERWSGDIVVLAAGAVNTAALLLASANAAHPNGLANGSDQVGRNYVFHTLTAMVSLTAGAGGFDLSQDPGGERLLLEGPARRLRLPDGAHPAAGIHVRPDAGGPGLRLAAAGAGAGRLDRRRRPSAC